MTKIEWTDETWNPIVGCSKISEGCKHCYALPMAWRLQNNPATADIYEGTAKREGGKANWTGRLNLNEKALMAPLKWKKPRKIFVNSMSDLFHENVPDEWIDRIFAVMALCPQHTFQALTKRPERMKEYVNDRIYLYGAAEIHLAACKIKTDFKDDGCAHGAVPIKLPLPNVWLGVSIEDQKAADKRIPHLLETPAAVRWLSAEPLLGPIDFFECSNVWFRELNYTPWRQRPILGDIHWVVVGGESGPGARPMHPEWARGIQQQCEDSNVPFLFKQWGAWAPADGLTFGNVGEGSFKVLKSEMKAFGDGIAMRRTGKKIAGRLLNGQTYDQYPEVKP